MHTLPPRIGLSSLYFFLRVHPLELWVFISSHIFSTLQDDG